MEGPGTKQVQKGARRGSRGTRGGARTGWRGVKRTDRKDCAHERSEREIIQLLWVLIPKHEPARLTPSRTVNGSPRLPPLRFEPPLFCTAIEGVRSTHNPTPHPPALLTRPASFARTSHVLPPFSYPRTGVPTATRTHHGAATGSPASGTPTCRPACRRRPPSCTPTTWPSSFSPRGPRPPRTRGTGTSTTRTPSRAACSWWRRARCLIYFIFLWSVMHFGRLVVARKGHRRWVGVRRGSCGSSVLFCFLGGLLGRIARGEGEFLLESVSVFLPISWRALPTPLPPPPPVGGIHRAVSTVLYPSLTPRRGSERLMPSLSCSSAPRHPAPVPFFSFCCCRLFVPFLLLSIVGYVRAAHVAGTAGPAAARAARTFGRGSGSCEEEGRGETQHAEWETTSMREVDRDRGRGIEVCEHNVGELYMSETKKWYGRVGPR